MTENTILIICIFAIVFFLGYGAGWFARGMARGPRRRVTRTFAKAPRPMPVDPTRSIIKEDD